MGLKVYLKNESKSKNGENKYMSDPRSRKNWPNANTEGGKGKHEILKKNDEESEVINHGDIVRIKTLTPLTGSESYVFAYSSKEGVVYYDVNDYYNDKQFWKVLKVKGGSGSISGELVYFQNVSYSSSYMYTYDGTVGNDIGCDNVKNENSMWTIVNTH